MHVKRGNKYRARGLRTPDGYFHSQGEYRRWQELRIAAMAKAISNLQRGERYPLFVHGKLIGHYRPDFQYRENDALIYEDFKSGPTMTEAAKLRIKLFEAVSGATVRITGKSKRGIRMLARERATA
jgi:Protein of unknown function (DUF1064)